MLRPETYVLGNDGHRYGPGQALPDGATVVAIDETSVLVDRDGLKERIVYAR